MKRPSVDKEQLLILDSCRSITVLLRSFYVLMFYLLRNRCLPQNRRYLLVIYIVFNCEHKNKHNSYILILKAIHLHNRYMMFIYLFIYLCLL